MHAHWKGEGGALLYTDPEIFLMTHVAPGGMPMGVSLSVREARELANALRAAALVVEKTMRGRCACGEPIQEDPDDDSGECIRCYAARARERRSRLHVIEGGRE